MLSVLSFSVLAAVIPNYDSHGILLARRAVNPDTMDLLWKRADEDQEGSEPSGSGAGASAGTGVGGSNLDYSSDNRGSSKPGRFLEFLKRLYRTLKKSWNTQKQKYARWSDRRYVQKAVKKVAGITKGQRKKGLILRIDNFLNTALESARMTSGLYDGNAKTHPFFLTIPKGDNQQALLKKMTNIQNDGKKAVKEHLVYVTRGIDGITKNPQDVVKELDKITEHISRMCVTLENLYHDEYTTLSLEMEDTNNEEHTKVSEDYITEMVKYRADIMGAFDSIKEKIKNDGLTFKGKTQSKFASFKSGVQKRLGLKKKSSTGVPPNPESSDQEESNQEPSDQGGIRPTPAPRRSKFIGLETYV
ncbi:hypothetical protein BASA62_006333 [Batrachochytrium salamandrivorans]|nr:hypothetical protein BASA62_006333 [Batrachochytrium salamandrivorans]